LGASITAQAGAARSGVGKSLALRTLFGFAGLARDLLTHARFSGLHPGELKGQDRQ
jgi:hypothetical protein